MFLCRGKAQIWANKKGKKEEKNNTTTIKEKYVKIKMKRQNQTINAYEAVLMGT